MIARLPHRIPAGQQSASLQTLVDYAPTLLEFCGLEVPDAMTGKSQQEVWQGDEATAREHVIIENRHQPTTIHMKTYIDKRYKITAYYNQDYGEIFDLVNDPQEIKNLWSDTKLRAQLMEKLLQAEMLKEESLTDSAKQLAHKSVSMYVKSYNTGKYQINFDPIQSRYEIYDLFADPSRNNNLWENTDFTDVRAMMIRALLFGRWGMEPLWMPRIAGA